MGWKKKVAVAAGIFVTAAGFLGVVVADDPASAQVERIDEQIAELEEIKMGYEARALRHEDYAEYLQFDQEAVLETRRHLQLAEENRAKAERVQAEIDKLEARKQKLLR